MVRFRCACALGLVFAAIPSPVRAEPDDPKLPQALVTKLDRAIASFQAGKFDEVYRVLQPAIESASDEQLAACDKYLVTHGVNEPALDLLVKARVDLVLQKQASRLRQPGKRELPALLQTLADRQAVLLEPIKKELDVGFRADMPHEIIDEKMQEYPGLVAQLGHVDAVLTQLEAVASRVPQDQLVRLDPKTQELVNRDYKLEREDVPKFESQLLERLIELAVVRIDDMTALMQNESAKYSDRFKAAGRIVESLQTIETYWGKFKNRKNRSPALESAKDLEKRWRQAAKTFEQTAGNLRRKAYLFEEGKKWWLRGRFGRGPKDDGMVKTMPAGVRDGSRALLYCPLMMPRPIPKPPDPLKNPLLVPVPRRHMRLWRVDERLSPLAPAPKGFVLEASESELPKSFFASADAQRLLAAIDYSQYCVHYVGYLEYQAALLYWEELLRTCSKVEQQALDEMLAADDRFVIHSNLSREYDGVDPNSSLKLNAPRSEDPRASSPYERRGLFWAMALARIELGAMRSVEMAVYRRSLEQLFPRALEIPGNRDFGGWRWREPPTARPRPNTEYGFAHWRPTSPEVESYVEFLWDGTRQQFYSVRTQAGSRSPATDPLVFARNFLRIAVVAEMLGWFDSYCGPKLSKTQGRELQTWIAWTENALLDIERALNVTLPARLPVRLSQQKRQGMSEQFSDGPPKSQQAVRKPTKPRIQPERPDFPRPKPPTIPRPGGADKSTQKAQSH